MARHPYYTSNFLISRFYGVSSLRFNNHVHVVSLCDRVKRFLGKELHAIQNRRNKEHRQIAIVAAT